MMNKRGIESRREVSARLDKAGKKEIAVKFRLANDEIANDSHMAAFIYDGAKRLTPIFGLVLYD